MTISPESPARPDNQPGMRRRAVPPTWEEIYRDNFDYVVSVVARLDARGPDQEDLAQEVFIVVHKTLHRYDPGRPMRPWLHGIAARVIENSRRWHRRHREDPMGELANMISAPDDPERLSVANQREVLFYQLFDAVPLPRRVVLSMHDIDGHEMKDIARELDITIAAGYERLKKGRKELAAAATRYRARWPGGLGVLLPVPFDPAGFLGQHRGSLGAPPGARDRVLSSIKRALQGAPSAPWKPPLRDGPARAAAGAAKYLASQMPGALAGAIGGGALVYALMYEAPRASRAEAVRDVAALLPAQTASASAAPADPPPPLDTSAATAGAPAAAPKAASSASTPDLAGETLLLEHARWEWSLALREAPGSRARQDHIAAALKALDDHARKYPQGAYAQARENLRAAIAAAPTASSTPRGRFRSDEQ
jgi:RNA polymerase sigma-70 factor (ECF subfamily)